jgi:hypothetical protein
MEGTQSTTRGAYLPDYGLPPKRALRKIRRQLRQEQEAKKQAEEPSPCVA